MEETRRKLILEGSISKAFFTLAVPIVLGNMLQSGYQLIDAFWVGRLGSDAVAAISICFPINFLILAMGAGVSFAGQTLSAQYMGAGRKDLINHLAGQTMLMVTVAGALFATIGYFMAPIFLNWLGVTPAVHDGALGFMRISFVGVVFTYIYIMFQALMRGIGRNGLPVIIIASTVFLNFLLDPFFIFGFGDYKGHGVIGAAYATLFTQFVAAAISILVFLRGWQGIHVSIKGFVPDFPYMRKLMALGFPSTVELTARALSATVFPCISTGFGTLAIASFGAGNNIMQIIIMLSIAFSITLSTLVGQNIGAKNIERAEHIANFGCAISFFIVTCCGALAFIYTEQLVGFFVPYDKELIFEASHFIRIMSPFWGLIAFQICVAGVFRAAGNMKAAMTLTLASQWLVQLPMAFALTQFTDLGIFGLWISFPITGIVMVFAYFYLYIQGSWKEVDMSRFHNHNIKKD